MFGFLIVHILLITMVCLKKNFYVEFIGNIKIFKISLAKVIT